jgi:enamine deaminase RidA (YjgF/YER057c/UK114 family)
MSQATSQTPIVPLRVAEACTKETCSGEVVAVETALATEIFARCAPTSEVGPTLDFEQQARRFYGCLPRLLNRAGADPTHVVWERVYFEDFDRDMEVFQQVRTEAYRAAGLSEADFPATTYIQQPPARKSQKVEVQTYVLLPKTSESLSVETRYDADTDTVAKVIESGGYRHLYIANIRGLLQQPGADNSFRAQCDRMFARCAKLLDDYGVKFTEVLRTWCYMTDIDNTYADFNLSRNEFFKEEGVTRLPASTGIEATLYPLEALCGMDLYAVLNPDGVEVEIMKTPTLNEAPEYGSAFSRGMKVETPEKTVLHISGTASVDELGATVHLDDPRKQMERMLLNIRELLAAQGASFDDLTQGTTFLKHAEYLELYELVLEEWGIRHLPNTLVEAGVCRPDLLCEMEAIAILPKDVETGEIVPAEPRG